MQVKYVWADEEGLNTFWTHFGSFFLFFRVFQTLFCIKLSFFFFFGGSFVLQTCHPNFAYCTIIVRHVAEWGIVQMCPCETKCQGGGVTHHFGGNADLPEDVSLDMGYRSDGLAICTIWAAKVTDFGQQQMGGGKTYRAIWGGEMYFRARTPKLGLEGSESGIGLVCARSLLRNITGREQTVS